MTRDASLERALREAELPGRGRRARAGAPDRARRARARPRRARRAARVAGRGSRSPRSLAALVVTQRDSGPAQAVERLRARRRRSEPTPAADAASAALALPAARAAARHRARRRCASSSATASARAARRWDDATWSPHGPVRRRRRAGRTLAAIEPATATVRWRLTRAGAGQPARAGRPTAPTSPTAPARTLRIVYGNGRHDVLAGARRWPPSRPPGARATAHTLAWAATDGTVTVEDADTAKVLWTVRAAARSASSPGRRTAAQLLVAGRRTRRGPRPRQRHARRDAPARAARAARRGVRPTRRPARARRRSTARRPWCASTAQVALTAPGRAARPRVVARRALAARGLAGRRPLARRPRGPDSAVAAVRHRFGAAARIRGWVLVRGGRDVTGTPLVIMSNTAERVCAFSTIACSCSSGRRRRRGTRADLR